MALNPPDNKRKRGRPPHAPERDVDASREPAAAAAEGYDADADDGERPKKRGRPSRSTTKTTGSIVPDGDLEPPKKSRQAESRHSPRHTEVPVVGNGEEAPVANMKRKRGRPPVSNEMAGSEATRTVETLSHKEKRKQRGAQDQEQDEDASQGQQRKRRGKSQRNEADEEPPEPEPEPNPEPELEKSSRRRRGRPPLQDQQEQVENSKQQQVEENQPKSRRRGRPSLKDMPPSEIHNQNRNPKRTGNDSTLKSNGVPETSKKGRTGRVREPKETRRANEDGPNHNDDVPAQEQSNKRKRRQSGQVAGPEEDIGDDDLPPSPLKPYTHIAPHVISVRQSTIKAKWSPLGESSLASISSILHLAHRPILQRLSNTQQRRSHTSAALQLITNRITRKLARGLPFPPPAIPGRRISRRGGGSSSSSSRKGMIADDGRSVELDFESVLDAKQALERQLDPALHAVELLTREKERLERELERDYEVLRNLETNARSQAREYRGFLKKAHVLAPTPDGPISRRDETKKNEDAFVHQRGTTANGGLFDSLAEEEEEDVKSLALQLSSHMDSIKNNLRQTDGILPQISRSRAALQDVLFRFLDQESFEQVVLG